MTDSLQLHKLAKYLDLFVKKSSKIMKVAQNTTTSGQSVDYQNALIKAGLWGGAKEGEFDASSPVAKNIFGIMDKAGFTGKITSTITVDKSFSVKIDVTGSGSPLPPVINGIKNTFEKRMSQALKASKVPAPAETVTLGWLRDVG